MRKNCALRSAEKELCAECGSSVKSNSKWASSDCVVKLGCRDEGDRGDCEGVRGRESEGDEGSDEAGVWVGGDGDWAAAAGAATTAILGTKLVVTLRAREDEDEDEDAVVVEAAEWWWWSWRWWNGEAIWRDRLAGIPFSAPGRGIGSAAAAAADEFLARAKSSINLTGLWSCLENEGQADVQLAAKLDRLKRSSGII